MKVRGGFNSAIGRRVEECNRRGGRFLEWAMGTEGVDGGKGRLSGDIVGLFGVEFGSQRSVHFPLCRKFRKLLLLLCFVIAVCLNNGGILFLQFCLDFSFL